MLLLGVDFETTGIKPSEDRIIEIGAALWSTTRKLPVKLFSTLVRIDAALPPEITEITGITDYDIESWGAPIGESLAELLRMADACDFIVAHNGNAFDKPLLMAELGRVSYLKPNKPWIDTMVDVPYPKNAKSRNLTYLAAYHGFVNPFAHRALSDVLTMLRVLSNYDVEQVARVSMEPNILLVADIKKPWQDSAPEGRKEADKAKARGFSWNGGDKRWQKQVKQSALEAELNHNEFCVTVASEGETR